ncbi:hypothetical protein D3C86_2215450 [compost metagenome]
MKAGEGAGWSSSGVPEIGTKGTTNGYTPSSISSREIDRMASAVSPSPARMYVLTCPLPNTATAALKASM